PIDRQVDEPDDGRLARQVAEVVDVLLVIAQVLERVLGGLRCSPGRRRIAVPVRGLEPLQDVALARDPRLDLEPRGDAQTLQRVVVGRVGHRDGERPVGLLESPVLQLHRGLSSIPAPLCTSKRCHYVAGVRALLARYARCARSGQTSEAWHRAGVRGPYTRARQ